MGRNTLILVDKLDLFAVLYRLLREERSDVPDEVHAQDAERLVDDLTVPSF